MPNFNTSKMKQDTVQNTLVCVSPNEANKKRTHGNDEEVRKLKKISIQRAEAILSRELIGIMEDKDNELGLHYVYGFTKHWFDKDFIKLK